MSERVEVRDHLLTEHEELGKQWSTCERCGGTFPPAFLCEAAPEEVDPCRGEPTGKAFGVEIERLARDVAAPEESGERQTVKAVAWVWAGPEFSELKLCPSCGEATLEGFTECSDCDHAPTDDSTWRDVRAAYYNSLRTPRSPEPDAARRLKAFVRAHVAGGCRRMSIGDGCECPLCDIDRLARDPNAWDGPFRPGEAWYAFDLDGTLARYDGWQGEDHIGEPVAPMVDLARKLIGEGKNVAILTARASVPAQRPKAIPAIEAWCEEHLGKVLPVTTRKDYGMVECYDDRATQVVRNDGRPFVHPDAVEPDTVEALREIAQSMYDKLADPQGTVTIFDQEELGAALRALTQDTEGDDADGS